MVTVRAGQEGAGKLSAGSWDQPVRISERGGTYPRSFSLSSSGSLVPQPHFTTRQFAALVAGNHGVVFFFRSIHRMNAIRTSTSSNSNSHHHQTPNSGP